MRIVFEPGEVREGLHQLQDTLEATLREEPTPGHWSYPGPSQDDSLRTWSGHVQGSPFTIALGNEGRWITRTPVLLVREKLHKGMTPLVEMNVPVGINRYVRGCLCADDHGHFFLMHRGTRFTVTPYVVTKAMAHEHFAEWLQWVDDGGQQTLMIPVGPIREDFVEHAAAFADQVAILKQMYAASQGHVEVAEATLESSDDVNLPQSSAEAPRRILRSVAVRDGQGEFRERLIDAYNGRCAVTRCNVEQVLEAAHILPFSEAGMNNLKNGLLLRADIHMLFDLGLIAVDTAKHPPRLVLSEKLRRTTYAFLDGRRIRLPSRRAYWPSHEALAMHRENAGL